jgi:hypothetical protein
MIIARDDSNIPFLGFYMILVIDFSKKELDLQGFDGTKEQIKPPRMDIPFLKKEYPSLGA